MSKKREGFSLIFILLLVTVISAVSLSAYVFVKKQNSKQKTTPISQSSDPYANWSTYTSSGGAFSFKYPSGWDVKYGVGNQTGILQSSLVKPTDKNVSFITRMKIAEVNQESYIEQSKNKPDTQYEVAQKTVDGDVTEYHEISSLTESKRHKYVYWKENFQVEHSFTEYHEAYSSSEPAENFSEFVDEFNLTAASFKFN